VEGPDYYCDPYTDAIVDYEELEKRRKAFCDDPKKYICSDDRKNKTAIEKNIERYTIKTRKKIAEYIEKTYKTKVPLDENKLWSFFAKKKKQQEYIDLVNKFSKEVFQEVENKLFSDQRIKQLKDYMVRMIKKEPNTPKTVKTKFIKAIQETKIVSGESIPKDLDELTKQVLQGSSTLHCGPDGTKANAFAINIGEEKFILLCKGMVTATVNPHDDAKKMMESLYFLLGHEFGHILHQQDREHYQRFKECIADHPSKKHLAHNSKNFLVQLFSDTKIEPHMGEIVADYWGVKMVTNRSHNYNIAEALNLVRSSFAFLCKSRDEGIHPNGHYRINFLLRSNPDLINSLACIKPTDKAYTRACPVTKAKKRR